MRVPGCCAVLERNNQAPRLARRLLHDSELGLGHPRTDLAELLLSELVTNAVLYGAGEIKLEITGVDRGLARFTVSDDGIGTPVMSAHPDASGGWGLRLLEQLALEWGVHPDRPEVWFTL